METVDEHHARHAETGQMNLDLRQLVAFLMDQEIAKHKLPERLEIVEEFPLSPFGKVSKKDLTERVVARLKADGQS